MSWGPGRRYTHTSSRLIVILSLGCHIPPVEDTELIQRIRSTNAGDRDNGLAGWSCKRCKKEQVAETSIRTTALRPDNSRQLLPADTHGVPPPNDQKREVGDVNVATAGGGAVILDATTQVSHNVRGTEPNDHGSQHQQQQSNRTGSYMGIGAGELGLDFLGSDYLSLPDTNQLPTTVTKGLQVKRVLQEQSYDHGHDLELYPDRPAASVKYARAPDGRKLVSPEHSSRPTRMNCVNSRSATLVSEQTTHSPSASRSDQEGKHVHYGSVEQNPGASSGSKKATASGPPVEHGDIHMKNFDEDSDDLYETPVSHSTPGTSSSKQLTEKQGDTVMQDGPRKFQQQGQSEEIDDDGAGGGVSLSHHEPRRQNSLATVRR